MFIKFLKDTSGATAIEYSLVAAITGIFAVGAISFLGAETGDLHNGVAFQVNAAINQ